MTWGSPDVYEITGSRTEQYTRLNMTAKVTLICPWNSRYTCMSAISQTKYPLPSGASNYYYSAYPKSFDVSVWEESGKPSDVDAVTYTKAKIDVQYECRAKYNERSVTETITPILNMRRLPAWGFYWASDGSPLLDDESPAIMQVQVKIARQMTGWNRIPSWFYELAGCVNDFAWTDTFTQQSYEADTLMFIPSSMSKQVTTNPTDEDNIWDFSFELMWNPVGWNSFMRPHGLDFMMVNGQRYYNYKQQTFSFV
jgi:hypothetical protein